MRLVYEKTEKEVKVGDIVDGFRGKYKVLSFEKPHKSSSSGKVYVEDVENGFKQKVYVGVIGAQWIEREDIIKPTEYLFDIDGNEYYIGADGKKHYTREEG